MQPPDLSALVGAVRLIGARRIRPIGPRALARFLREAIARGRLGPTALVRLHALDTPASPAIVSGDVRFDYGQLDARINRLAHGLVSLGVRPGDRVALLLHNGHEHIEATSAIATLGAVAVQIGYRLKPKEVAWLLGDSGARAILFHADYAPTVETACAEPGPAPIARVAIGDAPGFTPYEELLAQGDPAAPPSLPSADRDSSWGGLMTYTSGTTGRVKGARRDFRNTGWGPVLNFLADLPMRHDERHLVVSPL